MTIGDLLVNLVVGNDAGFKDAVTKTGDAAGTASSKSFGDKFSATIKKAAPLIGAVIGATFATGIKGAADFQDQLRTINTVAHLTDQQLAGVGSSIQALSRETGKSTADLSAGFYDLVSAGIPADKAISVLRDSAILATGALGTTGQAVDLVTSALNAYGLSADKSTRVTDIFAQAVADGKVTAAELGSSIATIAPDAAAAGVSLEQVAAGYALLTAKGVPAAQAATQMRAAISALLTPNTQLALISKQVGVNFADMARQKGLAPALDAIRKATNGDDASFAKALGSIEAYSYALATTGDNAGAYATELGKITDGANQGGVALGQFTEKSKSANEQAARIRATIATFLQDVGGPFVDTLGVWVQVLGDIPGAAQLAGAAIGSIATTAIPALAGAIGKLGIGDAVSKAATALGARIGALIAGAQGAGGIVGAVSTSIVEAGGLAGILATITAAAGLLVIPATVILTIKAAQDSSLEAVTENVVKPFQDAQHSSELLRGLIAANTAAVAGMSHQQVHDQAVMAAAWGSDADAAVAAGRTVQDALSDLKAYSGWSDAEVTALGQRSLAAGTAGGQAYIAGLTYAIGHGGSQVAEAATRVAAARAKAIAEYDARTGGFLGRLAAGNRPAPPEVYGPPAPTPEQLAGWKAGGAQTGQAALTGYLGVFAMGIGPGLAHALRGQDMLDQVAAAGRAEALAKFKAYSDQNRRNNDRINMENQVATNRTVNATINALTGASSASGAAGAKFAKAAVDGATKAMTQLGPGLENAIKGAKKNIQTAMDEVRYVIAHPAKWAHTISLVEHAIRTMDQKSVKALHDGKPALANFLTGEQQQFISQWEQLSGKAWDYGKSTSANLARGLKDKKHAVTTAAGGLALAVDGKLKPLPHDATTYGQNISTNIAAGMRNALGDVRGAAGDIATAIRNHIKVSSPAKEGPLSEAGGPEAWGKRLGMLYARGLSAGGPLDVVGAMGLSAMPRFNHDISGSLSGNGSMDMHVYVHDGGGGLARAGIQTGQLATGISERLSYARDFSLSARMPTRRTSR